MPEVELSGAAVAVTGAGGGIGAALARRFAAAGARVVVNDLDADAARAVADEVGGLAVPGNAGDEADVRALVDTVYERFGRCDVFCANAGIMTAGDAAADDAAWQRTWQVNVMSQVYAARALLPRWLPAGGGRLLVTASAAGLLTVLDSAPYAVTKHASVAFAEWLRAVYAHRGVVVQAICPRGVHTDMLAANAGSATGAMLQDTAITPEAVADTVWEAMADDRFLVLPHPEVGDWAKQRAADRDGWLAAMNKMQQSFEAAGPA